MGYDVEEIYVLTWETRPGAEVRCRSISSGEVLDWSLRGALMAEQAAVEATRGNRTALRDGSFRHMADCLAEVVVGWSLERRGVPLPIVDVGDLERDSPEWKAGVETNVASLMKVGHKLLLAVYKGYMEESAEVDEGSDLGKDSPSGEPYPEELGGTEAL